jgi:SET domain-containing protein 6
VLASQDIAAGEVVVEVPDDLVLMAENCSIADVLEGEGHSILEVVGRRWW